ncbi:MAG: hypothetical protein WCO25_05610 [Candidatus Uhrbacteria bacterium]
MRNDKDKAIALRRQGRSYGEICKALNLPSKGTLSVWFKGLKLSAEAEDRLKINKELARKRGLVKFNADRTQRIGLENKDVFEAGNNRIGKLSEREVLLVAAALYWGEGTKSAGDGRSITAVLTNSDPLMIRFYLRFLREVLGVKEEKIRAQMIVHDTTSPIAAKAYWQRVTGIDPSAISTTVQVSRASKRIRPKQSLPNGTLQIRVHDRKLFYKIKGMIGGLAEHASS